MNKKRPKLSLLGKAPRNTDDEKVRIHGLDTGFFLNFHKGALGASFIVVFGSGALGQIGPNSAEVFVAHFGKQMFCFHSAALRR